jgi:uncharacterized lipoprotein YmbA
MRPLLCLLLLTGCAVPTEPRVVQRQALQTMAPLDSAPVPRKRTSGILECETVEVWNELWVDGVRYWEILTVLVCP